MSAPGTGKARLPFTVQTEIKKMHNEIIALRGLSRINRTPQTIQTPIIPNASPSSSIVYDYLKIAGGSMIGPLAYAPVPVSTSLSGGKGHLSVASGTKGYTSNVLINAAPSAGNLSYIDGTAFDGQTIYIHVANSTTVVLKYNGNIRTFGAADFTITGPDVIYLMFDSTVVPPDGVSSGTWVMLSGGNSVSVGANKQLSNLSGTVAVNLPLTPDSNGIRSLGSATKAWGQTYVTDLFVEDSTTNVKFLEIVKHTSNHYAIYDFNDSVTGVGHLFTRNGDLTNFQLAIEDDGIFLGKVRHLKMRSVTAGSYTLDNTTELYFCNCSGGAVILTLPAISAAFPGRVYRFIKTDSSANNMIINRGSVSDSINGAASVTTNTQYDKRTLISDGSHLWGVF